MGAHSSCNAVYNSSWPIETGGYPEIFVGGEWCAWPKMGNDPRISYQYSYELPMPILFWVPYNDPKLVGPKIGKNLRRISSWRTRRGKKMKRRRFFFWHLAVAGILYEHGETDDRDSMSKYARFGPSYVQTKAGLRHYALLLNWREWW